MSRVCRTRESTGYTYSKYAPILSKTRFLGVWICIGQKKILSFHLYLQCFKSCPEIISFGVDSLASAINNGDPRVI